MATDFLRQAIEAIAEDLLVKFDASRQLKVSFLGGVSLEDVEVRPDLINESLIENKAPFRVSRAAIKKVSVGLSWRGGLAVTADGVHATIAPTAFAGKIFSAGGKKTMTSGNQSAGVPVINGSPPSSSGSIELLQPGLWESMWKAAEEEEEGVHMDLDGIAPTITKRQIQHNSTMDGPQNKYSPPPPPVPPIPDHSCFNTPSAYSQRRATLPLPPLSPIVERYLTRTGRLTSLPSPILTTTSPLDSAAPLTHHPRGGGEPPPFLVRQLKQWAEQIEGWVSRAILLAPSYEEEEEADYNNTSALEYHHQQQYKMLSSHPIASSVITP